MKEEKVIKDLIDKAKAFYKAAEILYTNGLYDSSVSRSYYAMFTVVRALLLSRGIKPKTHKGVLIKFREEFIKNGLLPYKFNDALIKAEALREKGDYLPVPHGISKAEAADVMREAKEFLYEAEKYLEEQRQKVGQT